MMTVRSLSLLFLIGLPCICESSPSVESSGEILTLSADEVILNTNTLTLGSSDVGQAINDLQSRMSSMQSLYTKLSSTQAADYAALSNNISDTQSMQIAIRQNLSTLTNQVGTQNMLNNKTFMNNTMRLNSLSSMQNVLSTSQASINATIQDIKNNVSMNMAAINDTITQLYGVNNTGGVFDSLNLRIKVLEDKQFADEQWDQLISNGDFEDEQGDATQVDQFSSGDSQTCGDGYEVQSIDVDNRPPALTQYNYSLKMGPGGDPNCVMEYQINYNVQNDPRHTSMCPGVYKFKAWVKVSKDYVGPKVLLHHRFFYKGGGAQAWFVPGDAGVEAGAWPRKYDVWTLCTIDVLLTRPSYLLQIYLGYPWRSAQGSVQVTGIEVYRVDGSTSSC